MLGLVVMLPEELRPWLTVMTARVLAPSPNAHTTKADIIIFALVFTSMPITN